MPHGTLPYLYSSITVSFVSIPQGSDLLIEVVTLGKGLLMEVSELALQNATLGLFGHPVCQSRGLLLLFTRPFVNKAQRT
jgi:hypothetical protein